MKLRPVGKKSNSLVCGSCSTHDGTLALAAFLSVFLVDGFRV